jgi:hypothetical protein
VATIPYRQSPFAKITKTATAHNPVMKKRNAGVRKP